MKTSMYHQDEMSLALVVLCVLLTFSSANADTVIGFKEGTFDSLTAATSIPATPSTSDNPTSASWPGMPTSAETATYQVFVYAETGGSPFVNGVSSGSATGGASNVLRFYDTDTAAGFNARGMFNSSTTSAVQISFDLKFNQAWDGQNSLFLRVGGGNNYTAGSFSFTGMTGAISVKDDANTAMSNYLNVGSWYHVVINSSLLDGSGVVNKSISIYDYTNSLVGTLSSTTSNVAFSIYDSINIKTGNGSTTFGDFELDNLNVIATAVPEPHSMILMGMLLGMLVAFGYRKYRYLTAIA